MPKRWTIAGSQAHLLVRERREIWSPHGRDAIPPRQPIDQPQRRKLRPINAGMAVCPSSCSANFSPRFGRWAVRVSSETSLLAAAGSRVAWESLLERCSNVGSIRRMNSRSHVDATVRWIRHREFGLAFTKVRPSVQRQIAQVCRKVAPL